MLGSMRLASAANHCKRFMIVFSAEESIIPAHGMISGRTWFEFVAKMI